MTAEYFASLDDVSVGHHPLSDDEEETGTSRLTNQTCVEQIEYGFMSRTLVKKFFRILLDISATFLTRLVRMAKDFAGQQGGSHGVQAPMKMSEEDAFATTIEFYANLNNDALHKEVKSICDNFR
jgi:hypothetical protein